MSFHFPISFKGFIIMHRGMLKRAVIENTATTTTKKLYKTTNFHFSHGEKKEAK